MLFSHACSLPTASVKHVLKWVPHSSACVLWVLEKHNKGQEPSNVICNKTYISHMYVLCVCEGVGGAIKLARYDRQGFGVLLKNTWAFLADKASYFIVRAQVVTTGPRAMHNQQILICWKALKGFSEQHTRLNHLQKMKHPLGSIWQRVQPHWGRAESTFSLPSVFLSLCISAYLLFSLLQSRQGEEQRRKRWGCQVMCCQGV